MDICSKLQSIEPQEGFYLLHTDNALIKLCFVTDEIVRIRASFDKDLAEESYILLTTAWEDRLDPLFAGERTRLTPVKAGLKETEDAVFFSTAEVTLRVDRDPLNFTLCDADGNILYRALSGCPFVKDSNGRVIAYSEMKEDDCFYGFGEKAGLLNKNKKFLRERATDAMGYDPEYTDTLYKHVPFYLRLDRDTHKAVGVFYHNFYESVFNMGCEKSNYWHRYSYFQADGGDIDCFLIGGDTIPRIVDNYTMLTGRPCLLPKRALGYQASSMYYPELEKDCDDAIYDFVDTIRENDFPLDGFHLSSGYTSYNNKRCVFTWNTTRFKDPQKYLRTMKEQHAQNVPNVKPGILLCHPYFADFERAGVFVQDSHDQDTYGVGRWWGGDGAFWDFTSPQARALWKRYLTDAIIDVGTDSVWNDNCEYDSLMDKDCRCNFDGKGGTIGQLKPLMSTLMCKIGAEAVQEHDANARPYMVCRSGSAGIQHYAQTWCGDNATSWRTLQFNIPMILSMGLSGQPNDGADIGGFAGPAPEEELFIRWVQHGIFQPRFSIHSASSDNTVTEPWMYSKATDLIREAIKLRYRFTPYLYSAEYEASCSGTPIMRPLVYEFQEDPNVYEESFTFLFGRDILVANVLEPGAVARKVYLPAGTRWFDWNDSMRCYEGGQTIEVPVTLASIPMFLREGAVVAMADNELHTMEGDQVKKLHLVVAPKDGVMSTLYDDDGISNDYKQGVYCKTTITMAAGERVTLHFAQKGSYPDPVETIRMEMIAKEKSPYWVMIADKKLPHYLNRAKFKTAPEGWYYSQSRRAVEIKYANPGPDYTLVVSFEQFDLIGM